MVLSSYCGTYNFFIKVSRSDTSILRQKPVLFNSVSIPDLGYISYKPLQNLFMYLEYWMDMSYKHHKVTYDTYLR